MSAKSNRAARDLVMGMVVAAMQEAEERGGPEGDEYVSLMRDIAKEASSRARVAKRTRYFEIVSCIPPVEGIDLGGDWNGWRKPRFTKASADAIVEAWNDEHGTFSGVNGEQTGPEERPCAWYDAATRVYWFYHPDADALDDFPAVVVDGVDHWDIGSSAWCWEEAPVTCLTLTFEIVGPTAEMVQERADALLDEGDLQDDIADTTDWTFLQADAHTEAL